MSRFYEDVDAELKRARAKFPTRPRDIVHAAAVVNEESGELVRAALQEHYEGGDRNACILEAIQTAAMCIRFLEAK